jgi:tripartite-type tricarboxylate transporter receptor subunit TctC
MLKKILLTAILAVTTMVQGQTLEVPPELQGQTIKLVLGVAPGGDTDITHRFMAQEVEKITGLKIAVINRPGAFTKIGAESILKAPADGLTVFGSGNDTFIMNAALDTPAKVDSKAFQFVNVFVTTQQVFYVSTAGNIKTVEDLINAAKNPKFNVGCSYPQGCLFLSAFFESQGIRPQLISYKSIPEVMIALLQGDIQVTMGSVASGATWVQDKKIKPLMVGSANRLTIWPEAVPLTKYMPQTKINGLQMISVRAGTPPHLVEFWNRAYRLAAYSAEQRKRFELVDATPMDLTVPQTEKFIELEYQNTRKFRHLYQVEM